MFTLIGCLLGFLYTTIVLPDNHGEYPSIQPNFWPVCYRGTFIVPISTTKSLHVHHWTITLALILLFPLPDIVYGFCVCLTVQGLRYRDRFLFIQTNPWLV